MTFSTGQIIFAICFILVFVAFQGYNYFKDKNVRSRHYKGVYWVFILIAGVFAFYFVLVKLLS